jgi:hypothetical protein
MPLRRPAQLQTAASYRRNSVLEKQCGMQQQDEKPPDDGLLKLLRGKQNGMGAPSGSTIVPKPGAAKGRCVRENMAILIAIFWRRPVRVLSGIDPAVCYLLLT